MRSLLTGILLLMLSQKVSAQFAIVGDKLCLRIYNKLQQPVKGAGIFINGVALWQVSNSICFGGDFCYQADKKNIWPGDRLPPKFKIRFSHPYYQSINDSIYIIGDYFYVASPGDDYVYAGNKKPVIIHQNHYLVMPHADSTGFEEQLKKAGAEVLKKYSYCGGSKDEQSGPIVYVVKVLPARLDAFIRASRQAAQGFEFGLLISAQPIKDARSFSGIRCAMSVIARNNISNDSIKSYLRSIPELELFNSDNYSKSFWQIRIKKEYLNQVISITEKVLAPGYFEMPVNELMEYTCLE